MFLNNNLQAFFALVKAGLWEDAKIQGERLRAHDLFVDLYSSVDWQEVMRIAEEQSVEGLVTAGLKNVTEDRISQDDLLEFIGLSLQIEQQNKDMNAYLAGLIEKLRNEDVYALLVKGQGIAQCYERPLWRSCGDIDLLLSNDNYEAAKSILVPMASNIDEEIEKCKHLALTIDDWVVELHGTLNSGLWRKIDRTLDKVQSAVFYEGKVRSWLNGRTQVFLPAADEDTVFVFIHVLQHFFKEGIGLRQICDWCRLLWTYYSSLDVRLLESRLKEMEIMTEWRAFAALAVDYLGMPVEAMPFYSPNEKWKRKARKIVTFVLETGNFGHNRDYSYYEKHPYLVFKTISLWRHVIDFCRYFIIFPLDSIKVILRRMCIGFSVAIKGGRHE